MGRDTLSDVLRAVRLRGAVFYYVEGASPWVAEAPAAAEIIPAILPGVEHMIEFHGVVEGACWAATAGEPPLRLEAGDLVLFPQGDAHVMSSAPGLRAPHVDKGVYFAPRPPQLPYALSLQGAEIDTARLDGGGSESATIACGFLGLDARPFNPLLACAATRAARARSHARARTRGSPAFHARGRRRVESAPPRRRGRARAHERDAVRRGAAPLRGRAARRSRRAGWRRCATRPSAASLGAAPRAAGRAVEPRASRRREPGCRARSLHERFVHLVGQPPMQYLTRMAHAGRHRRCSRDTDGQGPRRRPPGGLRQRGGVLPGVQARRSGRLPARGAAASGARQPTLD